MPGNHHHKAGPPPKNINEKKQLAGSQHSNSAPKASSSSHAATSTPKRSSPAKQTQTNSKKNSNWECLSHTEESFYLDSPSEGDNLSVNTHTTTSLPLWAHRYGDEHLVSLRYGENIDSGRYGVPYPPSLDQFGTEVNGLGPGNTCREAVLHEPYSQRLSAIGYLHNAKDSTGPSTYSYLQEDVQSHSSSGVAPEHLPTPIFDYQLGIWAYSTLNTEITLSERLEKSKWEPCLARL